MELHKQAKQGARTHTSDLSSLPNFCRTAGLTGPVMLTGTMRFMLDTPHSVLECEAVAPSVAGGGDSCGASGASIAWGAAAVVLHPWGRLVS